MKGARFLVSGKRRADEEEKPFWISFADLMTALMVLFLVAMAVALLAVTKTVSEQERRQAQYRQDIETIMARFEQAAAKFDGVQVDKAGYVIDFGERARFPFAKWSLSAEQEWLLRSFVPEMLNLANDDEVGRRIIKRFVVEGYTDKTGSYLSNLNLSLLRSQRVLCALFATDGDALLSDEQKEEVRDLFLVGGYSFNAAKANDEESRRVEMRLEFLGIDEKRPAPAAANGNFGECAIGG
ncbi:MAG: flagellar motor protein MotB [Desulfobulbaceae bacterium]|jgi:outer membrane protein OmpA-like peptidoglycan-associated protein|nr:flagellar motor protein MotB [Desulfobulbaceae bacterium]